VPGCFVDGKPAPVVEGLDTYLALMNLAYRARSVGVARTVPAGTPPRSIAGVATLARSFLNQRILDAVLRAAFIEKYQRATDLLQQRQYERLSTFFARR